MFPDMLNSVQEVMVRDVVTVSLGDGLAEAAKLMERNRIGCVVVVEQGKVVGILTERDFLRWAVAEREVKDARVGDAMTRSPVVCSPDTEIADAYVLMRRRGVRHVPVVEKDGKLVGIVTIRDLITAGKLLL